MASALRDLTSDGHIKIADFGSVKATKDTPIKVLPNSTNERACTFVGRAAYVPPERIIARDLKFPDYFSDEARDLIDKLLDVDPSKRPGAGHDGYASLKKHPFFRGIDWKNLRKTRAPKLVMEANEDDDSQDSNWLSHMGSAPVNQQAMNNGAASSSEVQHVSMANRL